MRVMKKLLSVALAATLLLGLVGPISTLAAPTLKDIKGHWAEQFIKDGVSHGYINGYEDGTFKPNNPVSRAEFCKMVNNALGVSRSAGISFTDVNSTNWFYEDVRRAVGAGYINGYENNTFMANNQISRQEAAVVISRIATPPSALNNMDSMTDRNQIASWAINEAKAVYAKGYMTGDERNQYRPTGNLTRAEAAKIIESILAAETVVRDSAVLSQSGQRAANTLYVGDVTVSSTATGTINLDNCRVLGTLEVAGGDVVNLSSTGVNQLIVTNTSDRVDVRASGLSYVKNAVASRGCSLTESSISGDGFTNVQLTGTALKGENVYLSGSFNNVVMNNTTNLSLSSGTIALLNVSANASGSKIHLARNTRVTLADVNASCDFTGTGNISTATVGNHSVTFETDPDNLNGSGSTGVLVPTVTPKNGATDVSLTSKITLAFDDALQDSNGRDLTASRVSNAIQLRRDSESGSSVPYSASVSSNYKTITITPDDNLRKDTEYYIIILNKSLQNSRGQQNSKQVFRFNTGKGGGVTTNPVDGAENIPVTTDIVLKFSEAMHDPTASGTSTLSKSYIEDKLTLRRGSSSGSTVTFTASVSSDRKTITITPRNSLSTDTKYYVSLPAGALRNSSRDDSRAVNFSFTTAETDILVPKVSPASGSTDVSRNTDITLTFDTALFTSSGGTGVNSSYLEDDVFTLRRDKESGTSVSFSASISSSRKVVTITPSDQLRADTEYFLIMEKGSLADGSSSSRDKNIKMVFRFTTGSSSSGATMEPTVSPKKDATGVDVGTKITLTFDERIYNTSGDEPKNSYLNNSVIELRKNSSTGSTVSFSAELTKNNVITVTPANKLDLDTTYYIIVKSGSLQNSDGTRNSKFTSYFKTGSTTSNTITVTSVSPTDGAPSADRNGNISLTFSEKLYYTDGTALNMSNSTHASRVQSYLKVTETTSGKTVNVNYTPTLNSSGTVLTLKPAAALLQNTTYTVTLTANAFQGSTSTVKSAARTFSFKTNSAQPAPKIDLPKEADQQATSRKPEIRITFNEAMEGSTSGKLQETDIEAAVSLRKGNTTSTPLDFTATITSDRSYFFITPDADLDYGETYYVCFTGTGLKGEKSKETYREINENFKVRAAAVVATPSITPSGTGADFGGTSIKLTFTGTVTNKDGSNINADSFTLKGGTSTLLPSSVSSTTASGKTEVSITLAANDKLLPGRTYSVTFLAETLKNSEGGSHSSNLTASFTTKAPTITITSATPVDAGDGKYNVSLSFSSNYAQGVYEVKLNGNSLLSGLDNPAFPYVLPLKGLTADTHNIQVICDYGGSSNVTQPYSLVIAGPSKDASLASVKVTIPGGGSFAAEKSGTTYSVSILETLVPADRTVTVNAIATDIANATVVVNNNNPVVLNDSGETTVSIAVTAEDGHTENYTLIIDLTTLEG